MTALCALPFGRAYILSGGGSSRHGYTPGDLRQPNRNVHTLLKAVLEFEEAREGGEDPCA